MSIINKRYQLIKYEHKHMFSQSSEVLFQNLEIIEMMLDAIEKAASLLDAKFVNEALGLLNKIDPSLAAGVKEDILGED